MTTIGFSLQPDTTFLDRVDPLLREEVEYFVLAPETLWRPRPDGGVEPNEFSKRIDALVTELGMPCVGHGVGFSPGTARMPAERRKSWLERVREEDKRWSFMWYSDHLGATCFGNRELVLPMAVPYTDQAAAVLAQSLRELKAVCQRVALETTAYPYLLGSALDEPEFLRNVLSDSAAYLVLDLHNVWCNAHNFGFDAREYLERMPLERVLEAHISGGSWSDPNWLASGRIMRLDSHDGPVPEEVWSLLEFVLPRCPELVGVTLERMEGTVEDDDVPLLREELRRARRTVEALRVR